MGIDEGKIQGKYHERDLERVKMAYGFKIG
jgi:hypothetical protein